MLNLGEALGSGIFSVPGVVLNTLGSVGLSLSFWVISPIFSLGSWLPFNDVICSCHDSRGTVFFFIAAALFCYTELASFFPGRSGAEVVFLEQAYPHPRFFVSSVFAITTVLLLCVYTLSLR